MTWRVTIKRRGFARESDEGREASWSAVASAKARHRFRGPKDVVWTEKALPALESGVVGAKGLRLAPLPPHSTTLAREKGGW
jgi:hypothetical protein